MKLTKCKLGDVVTIFDSKRVPLSSAQRAKRKGQYRYFGAQNVVDYIDDYLFDGEYMLVAEDGENVKSQKQDIAQIVDGKFWVNNHAHILQAKETSDLWYLMALLNLTDISKYVSGSAQPKLSQNSLRNIVIELPEERTQKRIGHFLSSLDRKIALNRRKIKTLEAMAKEIYDYWFVQYDFPDANGRPYKSSGGKMVYSPELKREIPEGWKVEPLPDVAEYLFGFPFDSNLFNNEGRGFPIVRIRNVKDGNTTDYTTEVADSQYIIHNGDFIIGMDGYFDMNLWSGGDAYLVQRSCRISARNMILQGYLRRYLFPHIKHLEENLTGATLAHLGKSHLDRIPVVVPRGCDSVLGVINKFDSSVLKSRLEISRLSALRDFLLPMLMNGQVEIR